MGVCKGDCGEEDYFCIRQRRQGEISAAVLLGGGAHDSFLAIVRLTEYNISTNNVEVCYV